MGVLTNIWLDTVAAYPGLFGKTMRDAGWPEAMTPGELAALMRPPIERGDLHGITIHRSRENFIATQCAAGVIEHVTKIEAQKTLILITAPAFAAWLLVQGETPSGHIQAWFDAVGADAAPKCAMVPPSDGPGWILKVPQRYQGYSKQLYDLLKAAHKDGKPCPKARDVLDVWKVNKPLGFHKVTDTMLIYFDADGSTKTAEIEAIRKAIKRLTRR